MFFVLCFKFMSYMHLVYYSFKKSKPKEKMQRENFLSIWINSKTYRLREIFTTLETCC